MPEIKNDWYRSKLSFSMLLPAAFLIEYPITPSPGKRLDNSKHRLIKLIKLARCASPLPRMDWLLSEVFQSGSPVSGPSKISVFLSFTSSSYFFTIRERIPYADSASAPVSKYSVKSSTYRIH